MRELSPCLKVKRRKEVFLGRQTEREPRETTGEIKKQTKAAKERKRREGGRGGANYPEKGCGNEISTLQKRRSCKNNASAFCVLEF